MTDGKKPHTGYRDIANDLRQRIRSDALLPGELLPSEPSLARQYGVNITTVRQAIAQLRVEGLVVTATGRGTTVRPKIPVATLTANRYRAAAEIAAGLRQPTSPPSGAEADIDREHGPAVADEVLSDLLRVPQGTPLHRRWMLLKAFGRPRLDITSYYPADLVAGVGLPDDADSFAVLHAAGVDVLRLRVVERIAARMPDIEETGLLGVVGVNPIVTVTRLLIDGGRVVEAAHEIRYPADRVEFEYEFDMGALA